MSGRQGSMGAGFLDMVWSVQLCKGACAPFQFQSITRMARPDPNMDVDSHKFHAAFI